MQARTQTRMQARMQAVLLLVLVLVALAALVALAVLVAVPAGICCVRSSAAPRSRSHRKGVLARDLWACHAILHAAFIPTFTPPLFF